MLLLLSLLLMLLMLLSTCWQHSSRFLTMDGREPCPYRILDDIGSAFAMGTIGSGAFHAFKGARAAPKVRHNNNNNLIIKRLTQRKSQTQLQPKLGDSCMGV